MKTSACVVLLALAAGVAAQDPTAVAPPAGLRIGRVPIHTAEPDGGTGYGVWAAADSYKASFHGNVTFIPYLGRAFAENQALSWRSLSVRVGDTELLEPGKVERHLLPYRCELRCGSVTEAWDVLEEGLEQTFVIHERPPGSGDLVVTGRIETGLAAASVAPAHQEIMFASADGRAVASYGKAFAVDANGNRIAATTSYHDGLVELRVAASWLEQAAFPVVVDPLLARAGLWSNSVASLAQSIEVARDDTGNGMLTVFAVAASVSDYDVYALMTSDSWTPRSVVFSDVNTWSTPHVQVAVAGDPQKYCVVFERQLPERRVRIHLHDSNDFSLNATVTSFNPAAGSHDSLPDVGGQMLNSSPLTSTGRQFLIVYQRDTTGGTFANTATSMVRARTIDVDGTLGTDFLAFGSPSLDIERPRVNQLARRSGSAVQRTDWLVVCQHFFNSGTTWSALGVLVSDTATVTAASWLSSSMASHRLTPFVAGHHGRYLVSYVETTYSLAPNKTTAASGHALVAERVDWQPTGNPVSHPRRVLEGPHALASLALGGMAYDALTLCHWAISVESWQLLGGTGRASVIRTGYRGLLTERQTLYDPPGPGDQGVAGGVTFDHDAGVFVTSIGRTAASAATVYGNRFTYDPALPAVVAGVGCSSGTVAWSGSQQIGAEFGSVRLTGAPAGVVAVAAFSLGTLDQSLSAIGMTGCRLLIDNGPLFLGTVLTVTSASGASSVPLALPETLIDMTFHGQWFHIDNGANPLNLVSTQRVSVNVVK